MSSKKKESNDGSTQLEEKLDREIMFEFGGPIGATLVMIFSPVIMYYFWICLEFYGGHLQYPASLGGMWPFWNRMISHIATSACPTQYTIIVYHTFVVYEAVLAYFLTGPVVNGLPIPSEGNRSLPYLCNGVSCLYVTFLTSIVLHCTGIFPLTDIVDNFGSLMSTAIITGNVTTLLTYVFAYLLGKQHRMSGSLLYDMFMGAWLNPRIGHLDLKLFAEIRIPWVLLFYISVSAALKQYQLYGQISWAMRFMCLAHLLYVNACHKGEECVPTTWDVFYEKWGYMLIFWNLAGVPFVYCHASYYLLKQKPMEHSPLYTMFCFTLLLTGYYIWDTANSQKNRFRMQLRGTFIPRKTFPQLPWGTLHNPTYVKTTHGNLLLTAGWWGIARKIHYTADLMMSLSWGLICGFGSVVPYFYVVFFLCVLLHRTQRDMDRCAKKYGTDWAVYCRRVPYIFLPGIY